MEVKDQVLAAIAAIGEQSKSQLAGFGERLSALEMEAADIIARVKSHTRGGDLSDADAAPRELKTTDGKVLPVLRGKQRARDFLGTPDDSDGFTIGGYCKDAIVGSRKAASGPALVPTYVAADVIDAVRRRVVLNEAGAGMILINGPTNMAQLTGDPTVHQHTEGADDIAESDILAAPVSLNPKTLGVLVPLTEEVVQDSPNLDALISTALAAAFAAKLDELGLATLLANANIPASAVAQNPAVWAKVLEAVGAALALNQGLPTAHISSPADMIARAGQLASTSGTWLGAPPLLSGMRELQTTGLTAGTALFGDFAAAFAFAVRSTMTVEVLRYQKPTRATHLLVAQMRADGVVLQPARLFKQLATVV